MFFGNDRQIRRGGTAAKPARKTMNTHNAVFTTLQKEYSQMDQEHARIRAKALANNDSDSHEQTKSRTNLELS